MESFSQKEILTKLWEETQNQSKLLSSIEAQVKATNGRVLKLENVEVPGIKTEVNNIKVKQEGITVKVGSIATIASAVIVTLITKFINNQ